MSQPPTPPHAELPSELQELPDDVPTLQAMVRSLVAAVQILQAEVASQREQLQQLQRNSSNSSKPPSSDPPWRAPRQKPRSERKRGGQPGHPGQHRRLLPPHDVDTCVAVEPEQCDRCGHAFPATPPPGKRKMRRHQVVELPPLRPHVTEYQLFARRCPCCRARTWAPLPPGVPRRCFGPRVQAVAALLSGACRLSRRQVRELLRDVFGVELSLGTLSTLEADTARQLEQPYQEVLTAVRQEPVVFVDETSWREAGVLHWLWTMVSRKYACYRLDRHRNREACRSLLGESAPGERPPPTVTTDRYGVYGYLDALTRSLCWSHLFREFRAAAERCGVDAVVGHWVLDEMSAVLEHWERCRAGELTREELARAILPNQDALRLPLAWGREHASRPTRALCRYLLQEWASLWAWVAVEGGEPTNNRAERALRGAVLWRKSSFGHQSETGKQFIERMLTVIGTLRLQHRNVWEFLVAACEAPLTGEPIPTLVA